MLITGIRRYEHITLTLHDTLYWLLIPQRINFKIMLMMFDCSRSQCPNYFGDVSILYTLFMLVRDCDHPTIVTLLSQNLEQTSTGSAKHRH